MRERKISKAEGRKRKEKSIKRRKLYRLQMYYRSYLLSRMRTVFTLHSKTKRTSNYISYFSFPSHLLIASDFSSFHSPDNYPIVNNSVFLYNLYISFHWANLRLFLSSALNVGLSNCCITSAPSNH